MTQPKEKRWIVGLLPFNKYPSHSCGDLSDKEKWRYCLRDALLPYCRSPHLPIHVDSPSFRSSSILPLNPIMSGVVFSLPMSIISQSDSQSSLLANSPSNKDVYLALSDRPVIIDLGRKSFQLDRESGKKCYMLAAKALTIEWGDTPQYWNWITMPESRFPQVAELIDVCHLEVRGVMNTVDLSPNTQYAAYLVFKMKDGSYGFLNRKVELSVGISNASGETTNTKTVCLHPGYENWRQNRRGRCWPRPNVRSDGWLEIEMGVFFSSGTANEQVQTSVVQVNGGYWKRGLIVQGIEVRPKEEAIYLEECFLKSIFWDT